MFKDSKSIFTSKTFWGSLAVIAVPVGHMLGVDLGDASGWAEDIVLVLGASLALYGRISAVKKIK